MEPDLTKLEDLRSQVSGARSKEVEARLSLRTIEERKDAISQRAMALENQANAEREAASKSISRRENRAQAAITAQEIADTAYEALIQIESSISKAGAERLVLTHTDCVFFTLHKTNKTTLAEIEAEVIDTSKEELCLGQ